MKFTKIICALFFLEPVLHDINAMDETFDPATDVNGAIPAILLSGQLSANGDDSGNDASSSDAVRVPDVSRVNSFRLERASSFGPTLQLRTLLEMPEPRDIFEALGRMIDTLNLQMRYIKNSSQPNDNGTQTLISHTEQHIFLATLHRFQMQQPASEADINFFFATLKCINLLISTIHNGIRHNIRDDVQQHLTECDTIIADMQQYINDHLEAYLAI